MSDDLLTEIQHLIDQAASQWSERYEQIISLKAPDGSRLSVEKPIPGMPYTMGQFDSRVLGVLSLLKGLDFSEAARLLAPETHYAKMQNHLSALLQHLDTFGTKLETVRATKLNPIDTNSFLVQSQGGPQLNVAKELFKPCQDALNALLSYYYSFITVGRSEKYADFTEAFQELSNRLSATHQQKESLSAIANEAEEARTRLQNLASKVDTHLNQATAHATDIQRKRDEAESLRQSIAEKEAEITQKQASVAQIVKSAEELSKSVEAYRGDSISFRSSSKSGSLATGAASKQCRSCWTS